ncbi:MAG: MBL fold metallo-hydrolase [Paracoccaceae bacterium]|nr:MBL fold metallo-hydrolase [Paracoccaceae bacterium]
MRAFFTVLSFLLSALPAFAQIKTIQVTAHSWAFVGPLGQRSPGNLGNNATFGLVVTPQGAVLMDPGGTRLGAARLHSMIQAVTDQPVKYVIDTGGQDHRWLGNGYWKEQGATIIASADAVEDQKSRVRAQLEALDRTVGEFGTEGTVPVYADITFADRYELSLGDVTLHIRHVGPAHTPGDSFVWFPDESVVFTGDIIYVQRILAVQPYSSSAGWLQAFDAIAALEPEHVVPGHGAPTDILTAASDTRDYLANLREHIKEYMDGGGDIFGSVSVDQSGFSYLENFEQLARRNAQTVFEQMEWE